MPVPNYPIATARNVGGITVWDEGFEESYIRLGNSTATRTLSCFCSQRELLVEYLMAGYVIQGNTVVQNLTAYPDAPWMYVDHIDVVPWADENGNLVDNYGMFSQEYAQLKVHYRAYPWASGQQGYITFRYGEGVLAPPNDGSGNSGFKWPDGSSVPTECAPPIHYMLAGISCHLLNQPPVAGNTIQQLFNNVNSDTFFGYGAGQVRFLGCSTETTASGYNPQGSGFTEEQNWEFYARSFSWNDAINPKALSGAANVFAAAQALNPPVYPTTAFSSLFPLGSG